MLGSVMDGSSGRASCRTGAGAPPSRTMKKTIGAALLVLVLVLIAVVLERTFTFGSRQPAATPVAVEPLDTAALAQRLAGALRFKTVSYQDSTQFDAREFTGFQAYLRATFPGVHAALKLEKVNGYGLLYEWTGSDPNLPPIILLAHQDVVPVEPGTESRWTEPPFEGRIAGGYVWGRGALDDKGSLVGTLEAVEHLIAAEAKPRRTVYLAFGYDEEVGGRRGAAHIADLLASRNVHPELVLDEGGALATGLITGISAPVALVGIAEKGYVTVALTAQAEGGHSSMPPDETAVGILAAGITRLEHHQMPRADGRHVRLPRSRDAVRPAARHGESLALGGDPGAQVRRDAAGQRDAPHHHRAHGAAGGDQGERAAVVGPCARKLPHSPRRQRCERGRARAAGGGRLTGQRAAARGDDEQSIGRRQCGGRAVPAVGQDHSAGGARCGGDALARGGCDGLAALRPAHAQ